MVFGFGAGGGGGGGDKFEVLNSKGQPEQIQMTTALKALQGVDRIEVKQRMSKLEFLTCDCWESKNKYDVIANGKKMFYAHETTGCCMRQFQNCFPDCAPWDVKIDYTGGWTPGGETAYHMKKDCSYCTFLCFNRPVTEVTDAAGNLVGTIVDPCACIPTNMTFTIRDPNGTGVLWAQSGCCQWGICCPLPCGPCKYVDFPVKDASGNQVGQLRKQMKSCFKMLCLSCFFEDVENYKIDFEGVKDPRNKAMLMALAVFTDFRYFHNVADDDVPVE